MADEKIKIQPGTEEVGQTQIEKKDEATDEFVLPTQEQLGEMSAEQLREIYPKLVDKYVEGKKMDTAAHYRNTEVARREEALQEREEGVKDYETKLYSDRQEFLNKQQELSFKAFNPPTPQPTVPDPINDPEGYMKHQQKQIDDLRETNKISQTEHDTKFNDLQTQIQAQRIETWVEKNITSKPEFDMVDSMDIEQYYRKNPQARSEYTDIIRVAVGIQKDKDAKVDAKVEAKWNAKVEAAKNAVIDPGAQYGSQKPAKWEGMTATQEEEEMKRMINENIKRGGGIEQL